MTTNLYANTCRTCLLATKNLEHLFSSSKNATAHLFLTKLLAIVDVELTKEDNLPQVICKTCSGQLQQVLDFVEKCQKSDIILQQKILNLQDSEIVDTALSSNDEEKEKMCTEQSNTTSVTCDICKKELTSKSGLKNHMRTHLGDKPYNCDYCTKKFRCSSNLEVHRRIHTKEKRLLCVECGKQFNQHASYIAHVRSHTGELPFSCVECPRRFKTSSHLTYHLRVHAGQKNHACKNCDKSFYSKGDLNQHILIHTGERKHQCEVCAMNFSRVFHLNRHMLTHSGLKAHQCGCGVAYSQKGDLVRHFRKHPEHHTKERREKDGS